IITPPERRLGASGRWLIDQSRALGERAMRHTRHHLAFTYVPLTNIKPIACPRCKANVRLIERAPLPAGLKGEMRTFECKKCGKQMKIIVED
ncbi:MAG: hypothetical protein WB297_10085, partial [Actinomycetota bacterium]